MSRSSHDTGHSCDSHSRVGRISTRSCPSGCPCRLASSPKSWRRPLSPWENKVCAFSTTSTTGSYSHSLAGSCLLTRTWCSSTSACWAFGSTGKRANSCQCRGSLFSAWSSIRSTKQHASPRNMLSQCWTASRPYQAGRRFHWNSFRGSWGIWLQLRWQSRSVCSIWDRFSTGSMAESRGGCGNVALRVQITPAYRKTFRPWSDPSFLRAGVPLEQVSRHAVVFTDASTTGWGATYNGHAVSGVWTGPQLHWHINCLELLAVRLALSRLRGRLQRKDVLVRTDNTATVAYVNLQGGLRSRRRSQLHLLLWSQKHLRSLRAIHIPGVFNRAADELSRAALPGEWRLHPQAVQLIWGRFGAAHVDLFASPETTHCQEFYSLTEATLGTDVLAHSWPRGLRKYAFPPVSLLAQTQDQGGRGAGLVSGSILAQQDLVPGTHAPRDSPSLANSSEEGSAFSETGHPMAPASGPVETPRMVPGWDAEVLGDLPQEVALTIASARAPSTRRAYTLKWNLFVEWCSSHQEDPRRCSIRAVLSFLQQRLERRLSPSTLKVYVAAISTHHDPVEGKSVGKHNLVVRFLRGARRLNPPRPPSLPSWDLALVLRAPITAPFEPLQSVEMKFLSMKTLLLTALASIKRVGDLQAFSVDDSCLEFGPADSSATLRPRSGYVPKVPTTPFRDQVLNLQALPPEEADPALALLCPVRALRQYTDRTQSFRTSEQLFVCYGGQQKGKAVSKQRMAHWIVDAITLAYEAQGVPCPLRLRAHSTRGVASSWALARGASLADICRAAGWATPNTFARFYSLRVEPVSSCVLTSNG